MYDPSTSSLIQQAPQFDGLNIERLPETLSATFAEIAAARIRLRTLEQAEEDETLDRLINEMKRLAQANEALVTTLTDRKIRAAAAFVSATAYQLLFNAEQLRNLKNQISFVDSSGVSANISAMLLFLIAEATADAGEMSRTLELQTDNRIERSLIAALRALAQGRLKAIVDAKLPSVHSVQKEIAGDTAVAALYRRILQGVRGLAAQMLGEQRGADADFVEYFREIQSLCVSQEENIFGDSDHEVIVIFAGPFHLASLLASVVGDLSSSAVIHLPPPQGVDGNEWQEGLARIADSRPYLWRNHREAIERGYLARGLSAVVGFPTGAGKSTLSELKILATLLHDQKVVFLAPTLALVEQTAEALRASFPGSEVGKERADPFSFLSLGDEHPEIFVMTPEACLTQMSFDKDSFEDVGLLVFDECHLLHPNDNPKDRRAIDAMLCVLNMARIVPKADMLLLSAMMKNTNEIAGWITDLLERKCLSLSLSWKPTRQIRGSVVYNNGELEGLQAKVRKMRNGTKADASRFVSIRPLGLFSLKQTWATRSSDDYALLPLLDEEVLLALNKYWNLTPNSGEISAVLACASASAGVNTLVFFQTIKNANSAMKKVNARFEIKPAELNERERALYDIALHEFGAADHLYMNVKDGFLQDSAAVHHGLLLPEERRLCESLYKRPNGVSILMATSTLAQGMNLPSEFVIIAEDSRFNTNLNKREVLEAHELLNAAGRAGRAGQNANGMVMVVPSKVVGFDKAKNTIGAHWTTLQTIFGQSDQCLDIDDPLTAVFDKIHANVDEAGEIERYCLARLITVKDTDDTSSEEQVAQTLSKSFAGFKARQRGDSDWLETRIVAVTKLFQAEDAELEAEPNRQVAAVFGVPVEVLNSLANQLRESPPGDDFTITQWRDWIFRWLNEDLFIICAVVRSQSLEDLFGKPYKDLEDVGARATYAVPKIETMTRLWMEGVPLAEIEVSLGVAKHKLGMCLGARRFVVRLVPELSYLFGLPAQLLSHFQKDEEGKSEIQPSVEHLSRCLRLGLDGLELLALRTNLGTSSISRRQLHARFKTLLSYLTRSGGDVEFDIVLDRVEAAMLNEMNDVDLDDLN